jgi:disulfide oxidoreductase YuzD
MILGKSSSKEYEEHVERALLRKYPKRQWILEFQCPIVIKGTKGKIDFKLINRKTGG